MTFQPVLVMRPFLFRSSKINSAWFEDTLQIRMIRPTNTSCRPHKAASSCSSAASRSAFERHSVRSASGKVPSCGSFFVPGFFFLSSPFPSPGAGALLPSPQPVSSVKISSSCWYPCPNVCPAFFRPVIKFSSFPADFTVFLEKITQITESFSGFVRLLYRWGKWPGACLTDNLPRAVVFKSVRGPIWHHPDN